MSVIPNKFLCTYVHLPWEEAKRMIKMGRGREGDKDGKRRRE